MEIRRLGPADLDSYFANRLRALQNSPTAFLTTYAEEKARGASHFSGSLSHEKNERAIFGAVEDGKVVAAVGIYKGDRPKTKHRAMIWGMYVDVDKRKLGLGGKILDLAIAFAKNSMDVAGIYLSVEATNLSAKNLYLSKGFQVWGIEPRAMIHDENFFDECHMAILL